MIRKTDVEIWNGLIETNRKLHERVKFLEGLLKTLERKYGILSKENLADHLGGSQVRRNDDSDSNISR